MRPNSDKNLFGNSYQDDGEAPVENSDFLTIRRVVSFLIIWYIVPTLIFGVAEDWDFFTAFYSLLERKIDNIQKKNYSD